MPPSLDVNDAIDPSFLDDIVVMRYTEAIDQQGRVVRNPQTMSTRAVVTAATPNDLHRLPEEQWMMKAIRITCQFRLQGPVKDPATGTETHPDEVLWHDSVYVVQTTDDYSGYGRGFMKAVAVSVNPVDGPPVPELIPSFTMSMH